MRCTYSPLVTRRTLRTPTIGPGLHITSYLAVEETFRGASAFRRLRGFSTTGTRARRYAACWTVTIVAWPTYITSPSTCLPPSYWLCGDTASPLLPRFMIIGSRVPRTAWSTLTGIAARPSVPDSDLTGVSLIGVHRERVAAPLLPQLRFSLNVYLVGIYEHFS